MPIRLLHIIPTLDRGGAEKQLSLLVRGLPREHYEPHVAILTRDGPLRADLEAAGVPVHFVGKRWKVDPGAYFRLKRIIGELRPDLVHTWIFAANSYGRAAARAAGVPTIIAGERCVDPWKSTWELAVDRRLARHTAAIVTNSSGVRDFYVAHGIADDKFHIIPNGVEPLPPPVRTRADLLAELNLPDSVRLVGAVGRLWPQKRYQDLIWAAELLKAGRGDTHLLIVGGGPLHDELISYALDVQIRDHVHFLGERPDVFNLLPHFDCFWLGSGYEGQSNALMEAMLCGLPVIATDIPGNRDLVLPEETGFLVPVGDAGQIARRTHQLFEDPDLAARFGAHGRQRMLEEFSVTKMIERHHQFYQRLTQT